MSIEELNPYIVAVVQALVGLLAASLLAGIAVLRGKVDKWLEARTTAAQRETLHKLAAEAMALAESAYGHLQGDAKLNQACRYVSARLGDIGIDVKPESIRAAIEAAVLEYNAKVKPTASAAGDTP